MKNTILTLAITTIAQFTYAQFSTTSGNTTTMDNVGIGTTNPGYKLDIAGNVHSTGNLSIGTTYNSFAANIAGNTYIIGGQAFVNDGYGYLNSNGTTGMFPSSTAGIIFNIAGSEAMRVNTSRNVGIGTTNPGGNLDVYGQNTIVGNGTSDTYLKLRGYNGSYSAIYNNSGASTNYNGLTLTNNYNTSNGLASWAVDIGGGDNISYGNSDSYSIRRNGSEKFRIDALGNFIINATNSHGYKLAVNGSAIAESMTVKLNSSWPDYVFEPKYKLPSLNEIKTYIDENQHLPEMPSEAEVAKNGINLGEIVKVQTKKIEELTLYAIDQQKQIEKLKIQQENSKLLTKRIALLEKALLKKNGN